MSNLIGVASPQIRELLKRLIQEWADAAYKTDNVFDDLLAELVALLLDVEITRPE
ncbi:MAG: hypothetical protein ACE5K8_04645 [Candidatus Zixiibacteriota bacterium]